MKTHVGVYRIEAPLGRGGMGVVYHGVHEHLGRPVAIKALAPELTQQPEFKERFFAEAKTQARLQHPNIVGVYDLIEEGGEFFIVMEFVAGVALDDRLKTLTGRGMDLREAMGIFGQVLAALDYAHSEGVIHRDIKPSNVLITENGRVKLTDYGIALLVGDKRLTASQSAIGTPTYMSPEQILRPRFVDHRTDIYSAAVVFYEMLAGRPPFDDDTEYGIKKLHVEAPPPDLSALQPGLPVGVVQAVATALAKNPEERFASAGLFLRALQDAAPMTLPTGATPLPTPVYRPTTMEPAWTDSVPVQTTKSASAAFPAPQGGSPKGSRTFLQGMNRWLVLTALVLFLVVCSGAVSLFLTAKRPRAGEQAASVTPSSATAVPGPGTVPAASVPAGTPAPSPVPAAVTTSSTIPTNAVPLVQPVAVPQPAAVPAPVKEPPTPKPTKKTVKTEPPAPAASSSAASASPAPREDTSVESLPSTKPEEPIVSSPARGNGIDQTEETGQVVGNLEKLSEQAKDAYEKEGKEDELAIRLGAFQDLASEVRAAFKIAAKRGIKGITHRILKFGRQDEEAERQDYKIKAKDLIRRGGEIDRLMQSHSPGTLTLEYWREIRKNLKRLASLI
ncbi:MAG: protein kinase domain-containing protein [Thermoanaerobaculia bacterium]